MKFIEMKEVYRIMMENPLSEFDLVYVRASKRGSAPEGSIKSVRLGLTPNARKKAKGKVVKVNAESKRTYLHKDKWTMSLYNYKKKRPETPLYSHVIGFNGMIVNH